MAAPVVRALDLGSGFAKLNRVVNGLLEYVSFPSLAPRHTGRDLSNSLLGQRDTVVVSVEGTVYEVGPDAQSQRFVHLQRPVQGRVLRSVALHRRAGH
jgi:hypothetical protein